MGNNVFGIGITGLMAAQAGLFTTSHNIANASTAGYSRQQVVQTAAAPLLTGAGFVGQGTQVSTITRAYDQFLSGQVSAGQAQTSALAAYDAQIEQINNLVADPSAGLSPALQDFFGAAQAVANDPATTSTRQAMLGAAQSLVSRFNALDQRLQEIDNNVNRQIASTVDDINSYTQQIAQLNQRIALAESSVGQPANDLRDQRDQLFADLNQRIGATVVEQNGQYNVYIGNGQPVVVGGAVYALQTVASKTDPTRTEVAIVTGGAPVEIQEAALTGGSLGGLLAFRSESLDQARNALGRVAIGLAGTFNAQHALGQDLNGALGGNFFIVPAPQVTASTLNIGNAVMSASVTNYGALTTSDYRVAYDGANYVVTRLSDGNQQSFAALPQTVDGVRLSITSGAMAASDQFVIRPTLPGAGGIALAVTDPGKIAAAAPVRTAQGTTNTGSATISAGTVNAPPPPNANLQQPVTITFTSANTFNVTGVGTGNPLGVAYTSGGNISYNGWTLQITGTPAANDTFTIGPNSGGVADNRNVLLLAALQTSNTLANGTATYQSAYSQLVSQVGDQTRQVQVSVKAQQAFLEQAQQSQQSFAGVNLDEEAANLVRYQQAYQASAKAMQIAEQVFNTLLDLGS